MDPNQFELCDLEYYLNTLTFLSSLPVVVLKPDSTIVLNLGGWKEDSLALVKDQKLKDDILRKVKTTPVFIHYDYSSIYFGVVTWWDGKTIIFGPCSDVDLSPGAIRAFAIKHDTDIKPILRCDIGTLAAMLQQIHFLVTGAKLQVSDLIKDYEAKTEVNQSVNQQIVKVMMRQMETITPHNDGSWEVVRRKCIMEGDTEGLNAHINAPFSGKRGVIAHDTLRNLKNLALVDV